MIKLLCFIDLVISTLHAWSTTAQRLLKDLLAKCPPFVQRLAANPRRAKAITGVALLHLAFLYFLIAGLRVHFLKPPHEFEMTLGGPVGISVVTPNPPKVIDPKLPTVDPPPIQITDTIESNDAPRASGSPNVTKPAEAIAEAHTFPKLPSQVHASAPILVRLLVNVAEDGSITDAQVAGSSGSSMLDALAAAWVKLHWRYRPAMRDGQAIAETTMAIVTFVMNG